MHSTFKTVCEKKCRTAIFLSYGPMPYNTHRQRKNAVGELLLESCCGGAAVGTLLLGLAQCPRVAPGFSLLCLPAGGSACVPLLAGGSLVSAWLLLALA